MKLLCELIEASHCDFPQILHIWSYDQDDGFGNIINTLDMCIDDPTHTVYITNFLGYDSICAEFSPCQYGEH